jgi:CDP-glucose 4,6-dehydratase
MIFDPEFYRGKRVLVTGHTGFKGSWLTTILLRYGAEVLGYSTCSKEEKRLFDICDIKKKINHVKGDVRDLAGLKSMFDEYHPEIVIHMAAQPIVRIGYMNPVETYQTNVMGTVNVLECVRMTDSVKSFLNVTTDKVYDNKEWEWGYRENDPLDGYDPYSNSKSCSELVTHCYKNSFFTDGKKAISTARAGNVIGGGDFAPDRIIPDCIRAAIKHEEIVVRNPFSTRPYQHVLEPCFAYLMIAAKQYDDNRYAGYYNVGPDDTDCYKTGKLVERFIEKWGDDLKCIVQNNEGPHEANYLKLDCSRLKSVFGWRPVWNLDTAISKTIEWTKCYSNCGNIDECMNKQIEEYWESGIYNVE